MLKLSVAEFYTSTFQEVALIIKAHEKSKEEMYQLQFIAAYNGNGYFHSKKFKPVEPFKNNKESKKQTRDEAEETLAFLSEMT